ncbi:GxxExxY protein [Pedobacter ginsenosidimutans]|uniref:GxxExxY protein n=1 Tax=Pedobacter ginsenosidimutans TaxID=687842 RepID=A0A0T5VPK4_9SPHI|nr:GxxExxY protein [Pedobacter ginsenosidimutans]KRT15782.1 GxxExxY protein [Pedobacter ginsenosidimutans]
MNENEIAKLIVNAAYQVHVEPGPGLLESAYEACLIYELVNAGLQVSNQIDLPVYYKDVKLNCNYRIDILVERKVIIEVKAVNILKEVHLAQTITYLKLSNCKLGLLINFNEAKIKDGIKRVINGYL